MENSFYVDNIEIPNINHFPTQGASGGPIGLINVDFIESVDFRAGGSSATYGDRLSSVMDIRFRDGNRSEFDGQLDPLKTFILPGGSPAGAALHHARTISRRAERRVVTLERGAKLSSATIPYLNRLSDLLFVMARRANALAGQPEETWEP